MVKISPPQLGMVITIAISALTFYGAFYFQVWAATKAHAVSDLPAHTNFIIKFAQENNFPAYSIWYRLVYTVSGLSTSFNTLAITSIALLTGLVTTKYLITYNILLENQKSVKVAALSAIAMIIVMPLISYYNCSYVSKGSICISSVHVYLGNISPNQWHNSTLILAMPINLILFYYSIKHIHSTKQTTYLKIGAICALSIICKPSYAMSFLPILCIAILIVHRAKPLCAITNSLAVAIPSMSLLLYQWYETFIKSELLAPGSKTVIAPFYVWSRYSPHIAFSLLLSLAFPLFVLLFFWNKLDSHLKFAWLGLLSALTFAIMFSESPNWGAGNYFWSVIASNYILFVFSLKLLLNQRKDIRTTICYSILNLHVMSGILFLAAFMFAGITLGKTSLMF